MSVLPLLSQPCEDRDFAEWHWGCAWCAVWVVWLPGAALARAVQAGRQALGAALLPYYDRQPHVTVAYRGLCAGAPGHPAAEFGAAQLRADVATLQAAAVAPFAIQIQGVGSFTTVPYLAVAGAAGLEALHGLHDALVPELPAPGWRYVPHVTLGHYAQALPLPQLVATLQAAGVGAEALSAPVGQLALVRYATSQIAGPLAVEGLFDLHTRRYTPQAGALLGSA